MRSGSAHRIPVPTPAARGRIVVAAVAAGAFVAAGQAMGPTGDDTPVTDEITRLAAGGDATNAVHLGTGGAPLPSPEFLPLARAEDPAALDALAKGERIVEERAAREAETRGPLFVLPAEGTFTSGFGARWGTTHLGIDIANSIGTPILAAADGVIVESGPASGFGLWIKIEHEDGTITVYGHINQSFVEEGDEVRAGDEIAEMGNRGQSTGPHLHFEVWENGSEKVNPMTWLQERGIEL